MTDDAPDQNPPEQDLLQTDDYAHPDPVLELLVSLANSSVGMSVTLNIGGRTISGVLRSGADWFDANADALRGVVAPDGTDWGGDTLADHFHAEAEGWREKWADRETRPQPVHIHMVEAWDGQGRRLGPWRGRLIAVTDWSLGAPDWEE